MIVFNIAEADRLNMRAKNDCLRMKGCRESISKSVGVTLPSLTRAVVGGVQSRVIVFLRIVLGMSCFVSIIAKSDSACMIL